MDDLKSCSVCEQQFGAAVLVLTAEGIACPRCATGMDVAPAKGLPAKVLAAAALAVVPFFLQLSTGSTVRVNGEIVESHHTDYVAIMGGGLALIVGAFGILSTLRAQPRRRAHVGIATAVLTLAAFQLVRGFGLLGS